MNCSGLRDKILKLPYIESKTEFEESFDEIYKTLVHKKFAKSSAYLEKMHKIKHKWSEAFLPNGFTGGIHTTSRAESMNALVKKFCNSGSEISDIIKFLKTFEKKFVFEEIKTEKDSTSQY